MQAASIRVHRRHAAPLPVQVKDQGYEVCHDGNCITVFSAPNYCDQMGNKGELFSLRLKRSNLRCEKFPLNKMAFKFSPGLQARMPWAPVETERELFGWPAGAFINFTAPGMVPEFTTFDAVKHPGGPCPHPAHGCIFLCCCSRP